MQKLFSALKIAAISGTAALLCVPFAMDAAMPDPVGSIYNSGEYNLYQPGQTVTEESSFVALPIKGLRTKDLQGADEGTMNVSSVLSYPQDRNWLVFSVTIYNPEHVGSTQPQGSTTHKVFRYNLSTGQLQRIYREFSYGERLSSFWLTGFDGNKLVVRKSGWDISPGACSNFWDKESGMTHYALDMRSPWNGLKPYNVPKKLIDLGKAESQACTEDADRLAAYCTEGVASIAECGDYMQIISNSPTGALTFKNINDGSTQNCTMDPESQTDECRAIVNSCTATTNCVY